MTDDGDLPQELVSHFETHCTGGERGQAPGRHRGEAAELCSVYQWTCDSMLRTNESLGLSQHKAETICKYAS